ncbi:LPS assembly lipoprotein LptE [Rhodovibrio salinarum]|uniref:LPS-assembly lipoprotein n=1 Tax=Rhodovibrio salinarum TaxID=1087 RepID=A0A934QHI3_9PROT|nr:LPS assembly lipoprotein LptE [Rhodovibrio salinarum]MBK1696894.1 hypothetical protein [Rhodovibrio salinarum]
MWLRNDRPGRRRIGPSVAAAALLLALAGCGFQPMYGERATPQSGQVSPSVMNSVAIVPLSDRLGQQLHNALRDQLNPRGQPSDPKYRLAVQISSVSEPSTLRSDGTATRRRFQLRATWQLESYDSSESLFSSSAEAATSYNVGDQPYATVTAFEDAQERVVDQVARLIATRANAVLAASPEKKVRSDQ